MVPFSHDRRSGRDRRSGGDRRQIDRRQPRNGEEATLSEEDLERAAEMTAHLGEVWHNKGKGLFDRNKHEEAARALKKSVEIRPDIAESWFLLACIESMKGDKTQALAMLSRAVALDPEYKEKSISLGAFKKYKGDKDFENIVL